MKYDYNNNRGILGKRGQARDGRKRETGSEKLWKVKEGLKKMEKEIELRKSMAGRTDNIWEGGRGKRERG